MQTVIIGHNAVDPSTWVKHEVADIRELLLQEFEAWPDNAHIYHEQVSQDRDVTPYDEASIERLGELEGVLYVVVYPGDLITAIIAIVSVIASVAITFLLTPPVPTLKNTQSQSANNALSERSNKARPNARIPDIFGTVRSTPDLLAVPYKIFVDHKEVEVAYMCVGKGFYEIDDILDDTTPIEQISGASVEVYDPLTSPNSGTPVISIGSAITQPLVNAKRYNSVNGQVLEPPSGSTYYNVGCKYHYPNKIIADADTINYDPEFGYAYTIATDLTQYFQPGGTITVVMADWVDPATSTHYNLSGTFTISTVSTTEIVLSSPEASNAVWATLDDITGNETASVQSSLSGSGVGWVGPFVLDVDTLDQVLLNFVALNGLYKDDGKNQYAVNIDVEVELTPIDIAGVPTGSPETFTTTVLGTINDRSTRAVSLFANPTFTGRCKVRARRTTAKDTAFKGTVVDEIKWRDVYSISPVAASDFGDVTTVFAVTYATEGALAVKDRKLNMLVTRKLPARVGTTDTFTSLLYATNNAADIICAMALDPFIGNRDVSELDVSNIYDSQAEVVSYFGTAEAGEFNYTFDDNRLSFEESVASVAAAMFCQAYRQGSVISLSFERETQDSLLLFNHRNKLPGSETRTVRFGPAKDYDGVEYQYVDPIDDAIVKYYIPIDRSAVNPKKIESIGVRSNLQAYFAAWRAWNKIRYQNTTTEFEATQEADLLVVQDRVLVADSTRPDVQDGQVEAQNGLELTLSQPVSFEVGVTYTIFLQHVDKTVEAIGVTPGSDPYKVVLANAPRLALSLDRDNFAVATFQIVGNTDARNSPFLITEKSARNNFTVEVKAINYSDKYYQNDQDHILSLI
jgi:hypothetical protein